MKGLKVTADGDMPTLYFYDDIGPEWLGMVSAEVVTAELDKLRDARQINVRINSPGGDVFEGFAIYNALVRHKAEIIVDVDALAASAASVIAMAGDKIRMAENSMLMIHQAWTIMAGNKQELVRTAELLGKIDQSIVDTYAARTGLDQKDLTDMLNAETWMRASEAIEKGFADEVSQPLQVSARVAKGRYKNTPAQFLTDDAVPPPKRQELPEDATEPLRVAASIRLRNQNMRLRLGK